MSRPPGTLIALKQGLTEQQLKVLELELDRRRKSAPVAYLLWFFLSWIGLHKFYLGKVRAGVAYIAAPWLALILLVGGIAASGHDGGVTAVGGGLALLAYVVWWLIDLVTLHRQVEKFNEEIEAEVIHDIRRTAS